MIQHLRNTEPFRELFWQVANRVNADKYRRKFQQKNPVYMEKGSYVVKTISTGAELEEVMRLRYDVFHREYRKKNFPFGVDTEPFDLEADHLVIIDTKRSKIVGTYRLLTTKTATQFYSESEFEVAHFLRLPGTKLELSRACIEKNYRKGTVMHLLWRGLSEYIRLIDAEYLFGCSSVKTTDPSEVVEIQNHLKERGVVTEDYQVQPTPNYRMDLNRPVAASASAKSLVPPLLEAYFRAGARVASVPALDLEFSCVDFFTVLNLSEVSQKVDRRYAP